MQIQLNTDKNISGTEKLEALVSDKVNRGLKHHASKITRVEVHLSDQNADKGGADDIQCKLEVRVQGMQPVTVASKSSSKETAIDEAVSKMKSTLDTRIGKLKSK
jgi:ribosomal subunit interface protein